ncbi:AraC family transcriptional regulator [Streptomyces sp. NRRL F-5126]|uniref:AraC family transcriptional regulator n=1 Tax=Streptomyces sp. NRRL F-5126 TaxID=1463857 RepID=UPI0004C99C31|nr:AraC family transcriptional regulator [Streptomyces sp. NRRL F-5126]
MADDRLSEVFDLVEVRSVVSGGFAARGPWVSRAAGIEGLKFIAVLTGRARLTTDGVEGPLELEGGDVAVLNGRSWLHAEGGTGDGPRREVVPEADFASTRVIGAARDADVVVGGHVTLNEAGRVLLLRALPPVAHVRGSAATTATTATTATAANVRGTLHRLFDEVTRDRMGSSFAIRQYGQLLLLEVLRAYIDQATELPPGWLRLLSDEQLRPALDLMHSAPGKPWGLRDLAHASAMSRTSFAERFRTVAGVPPLTYLARWRMTLAERALRDGDVRVGSLAAELGYASESSFSTAFKREVGISPLRYRYRARGASAPARP